MPTYSYACTECENRFDVVQAFSDDALTTCEKCSGRLRKLFGNVGVVFKGSGFYRNDSREASKSSSGSSSSSSSSSSSEGSGSRAPARATSPARRRSPRSRVRRATSRRLIQSPIRRLRRRRRSRRPPPPASQLSTSGALPGRRYRPAAPTVERVGDPRTSLNPSLPTRLSQWLRPDWSRTVRGAAHRRRRAGVARRCCGVAARSRRRPRRTWWWPRATWARAPS